jgi:phosphoglycerate kinase
VVLLENVRFEAGEVEDDDVLAARLAVPGRAFVFDAFGAAHRSEASTVGVARHLPSHAGLLVQHEVAALEDLRASGALDGAVVVVGGVKAADKLPALARLAERAQAIVVGGAVAHALLAATGDARLGASIVDRDAVQAARDVVEAASRTGCELVLPTDVIATDGLTTDARIRVEAARSVPDGAIALDIGPETRAVFGERIAAASTVIWDGPPGAFEMDPFAEGTRAVATAIAKASGTTVVGGGDTGSALRGLGLAREVDYLSTGGGSMLHLLAGLPLAAIEGLRS